jgi:mono/diheme cytochrome c family protein
MLRRTRIPFTLATLVCAGCAGGHPPPTTSDEIAELPAALDASYGNIITEKGDIAFNMPVAGVSLARGELDGYTFTAKAGSVVRITMSSDNGAIAPRIYLYGLADGYGTRYEITHGVASTGGTATLTGARLDSDGQYEMVVGSKIRAAGPYTLTLGCDAGACVTAAVTPPGSFADTRIAQHDIDAGRYSAEQLFAVGDFIFSHDFTIEEGLGNALTSLPGGSKPRPNERRVQYDVFGGPDGDACANCHDVGGDDGGGALIDLALVEGDGDSESSALLRNGLALLGDGAVQQLAFEMTHDLAAQITDAKKQAMMGNRFITVMLQSKGVSFGSAVVRPTGDVDGSGIVGIDVDLVVRPLGWKGAVVNLRRFIEGALQAHHGMQAETLIAQNCTTPIPAKVGNGADCHDPDGDGVLDEITEGQLTALAIYAAMQPIPVQILPTTPTALARVQAGQQLFTTIGCADCHRPSLTLADPHHAELPDLTGGPPFVLDLTRDAHAPRLAVDGSGQIAVALFSDLKRHDMGAANADVHDTRGVSAPGAPVAPRMFLTRPLWGVAVTAPYLHDGRAPTLRDAILGHDGEAATARSKFVALSADDAAKLLEFLGTLGRAATTN